MTPHMRYMQTSLHSKLRICSVSPGPISSRCSKLKRAVAYCRASDGEPKMRSEKSRRTNWRANRRSSGSP